MARCKHIEDVKQHNYVEFDQIECPGNTATQSGIYRCTVCKKEIVVKRGDKLPDNKGHINCSSVSSFWVPFVLPDL